MTQFLCSGCFAAPVPATTAPGSTCGYAPNCPRTLTALPASRVLPGGLALALLVFVAANAEATPSEAMWTAMEAATVRILCIKSPTESGGGSGFVIGHGNDSRYVVTNWHVVDCSAEGGSVRVANGSTTSDLVAAQVRGHHEGHDLAVLETASALGRAPARLATVATVRKRDSVWAYGFPGAGDLGGVLVLSDSSVANGVVGRLLLEPPDRSTPRMIQHSAGINPGNSGGPLFDDFGRVIGVNTLKSLAMVPVFSGENSDGSPQFELGRVPLGEGIGWSVISDELLQLLDRLRIPYQVTTSRPSTLATLWHRQPVLVVILGLLLTLSATAMSLAITPRGRAMLRERITEPLSRRYQGLPRPAPPAPPPSRPRLRGLAGPYASTEVPLEETPIAIGRDPKLCQLVIPPQYRSVSKRHALISYDANQRSFLLEDCWSTQGTFVQGKAIPSGEPVRLRSGERFELASAEVAFEVINT